MRTFILISMGWRTGDMASLVQLLLIGTMLSGGVVFLYQRQPGKAFQHALIWIGIAFVLVALYTNKDGMLAALVPGNVQHQSGAMIVRAAADGHFYINGSINNEPVRFMIDTGASGISLPLSTAKRVGLQAEHLAFTQAFQTANGQVFGAPVMLERLEIGGHVFENISAFVNQGELGTPLMGMRFLERAESIEIKNDQLIIRFQ